MERLLKPEVLVLFHPGGSRAVPSYVLDLSMLSEVSGMSRSIVRAVDSSKYGVGDSTLLEAFSYHRAGPS